MVTRNNDSIMKRKIYALLGLCLGMSLCLGFVTSCDDDDELNMDHSIVGLGGETWSPTELDNWLYENFVKPYNIDVKYKWDQFEVGYNYTLVPPVEAYVQPVMTWVRDGWIHPYEEVAGAAFVKKLCPKKYVLVGSARYNTNGTITIGEAEGGKKITLFRINWYQEGDKDLLQAILKTVHHEFAHTLHQTIRYPEEYMNITPGGYTSQWNNVSDAEAMGKGYISPYACSSPDEDFAEMIARIVVYGRKSFDSYVTEATRRYNDPEETHYASYDPGEALRQKESMIITYLKDVWGIELYDPAEGMKGLETLVQEAIAEAAGENVETDND